MSKSKSSRSKYGMFERRKKAILLPTILMCIMQTTTNTSATVMESAYKRTEPTTAITTTISTTTSTIPTTTTANTTTITTTTTSTTTTIAQEIYVAEVEETVEEPMYVEEQPIAEYEEQSISISDSDFILLCNAVGHESGSNWISNYDKALVAEVVMNRVESPEYPDTIYGVITQPGQFSGASGYADMKTYSGEVTESVKEAVQDYFNNQDQFQHGYLRFYGDGYMNHFS